MVLNIIFLVSSVLQVALLVLSIKLLKRDYALALLSSRGNRIVLLPLTLSLVFVPQLSKTANVVALLFFAFAFMNLAKAKAKAKAEHQTG